MRFVPLLLLGLGAAPIVAQNVAIDFDVTGPTTSTELVDFFDFLGADPTVGEGNNWEISANTLHPVFGNSLRTNSDGGELENWFSRVALLKPEVFEGVDLEYSVDITFDDNDHVGPLVRFSGNSNEPLGNDYYSVQLTGNGNGNHRLHRVKDGVQTELERGGPAIVHGDTVTVTVRAMGNEITVSINGEPIEGMDPFVDPDPILAAGRVGVSQNTQPGWFDNMMVTSIGACRVTRELSESTYLPGDEVHVILRASNLVDDTTIVETIPEGFSVLDAGAGVVDANTITFVAAADAEFSYSLMTPDNCDRTTFRGTTTGTLCSERIPDSVLRCGMQSPSAQLAGDCTQDGVQDVSDLLCYVGRLFPGFNLINRQTPPSPCATEAGSLAVLDVSGDGSVTTVDVVSLSLYLFGAGGPPAAGESCFILAEGECSNNVGCQ